MSSGFQPSEELRSLTKGLSLDMLNRLKREWTAQADQRDSDGAPDFAAFSRKLVALIDIELTARGATPGQNGDKG